MKYQDLCIKLSEVLRAKGINTIYFEDVNLLNSEDVIYPAAVVQLVRVEQESHSDRYTIMLTIAKTRQEDKVEYGTRWINIDRGLTWQNGSTNPQGILNFGSLRALNELQVFGTPNAVSVFRIKFSTVGYSYCNASIINYETPAITNMIGVINARIYENDSYTFSMQNYTRVVVDFYVNADFATKRNAITLEQEVSMTRDNTPNIYDIRGITGILANDEHIQINSCVTTPFRWKFRDECEGITAEINLSLFFDSRCN